MAEKAPSPAFHARLRLVVPGVVAFLGLLLLPTLIFRDSVRFEPARFVEEWIKGVSTGFVLYILATWLLARTSEDKAQATELLLVQTNLLLPLSRIKTLLESMHSVEDVRQSGPQIQSLWELFGQWKEIMEISASTAPALRATLRWLSKELGPRVTRLVSKLNASDTLDDWSGLIEALSISVLQVEAAVQACVEVKKND